jgi:sodium-dependent phosphate cotransporter
LGANIGTTITALLSATAIIGPSAPAAMTIALVHLFFNLFAVAIIYGIKWLREIPLYASEKLSELAVKNRIYAFLYLLLAFFVIPGLGIFIAQ